MSLMRPRTPEQEMGLYVCIFLVDSFGFTAKYPDVKLFPFSPNNVISPHNSFL